jgi:hypothetical protein
MALKATGNIIYILNIKHLLLDSNISLCRYKVVISYCLTGNYIYY